MVLVSLIMVVGQTVKNTHLNVSVNSGDHILICRDSLALSSYLRSNCFTNFNLVIEDGAVNQNGNDAIELFMNGNVLETFGDLM